MSASQPRNLGDDDCHHLSKYSDVLGCPECAHERVVAIREDGSLRIEPDDDPYDPLLHKERKEYA